MHCYINITSILRLCNTDKLKYLLAVARQRITVTQNAKNNIRAVNVNKGWKNKPGNSAKHLALSLNNAVINPIRFLNMLKTNNKMT